MEKINKERELKGSGKNREKKRKKSMYYEGIAE